MFVTQPAKKEAYDQILKELKKDQKKWPSWSFGAVMHRSMEDHLSSKV